MKERVAIYPGSFDPVHYGHVDVVQRGLSVFDRIIILIAESSRKKGLFSISERKELLTSVFQKEKRVTIDHWSGLLMKYAQEKKVAAILRGLRAVSDFEYEFQMASMNKKLYPRVDTLFVMTSERYHYVSSQLVREVGRLGGGLKNIVPPVVDRRLKEKFKL